MNAKEVKQKTENLEVGGNFRLENLTKNNVSYLRQIVSSVRKEKGYFLNIIVKEKYSIVERLEDQNNLGIALESMKTGEVAHFDLKRYDSLRAYSARYGIKVKTVVEVVKL